MNICRKCNTQFNPSKGLINYCSLKCRNSKVWSEADKNKKSNSAKLSIKVKTANQFLALKNVGAHRIARVNNICPVCKKNIESTITRQKKYHAECYKKVVGGFKKNSGRGKCGWYKGIWCQSSYELAFVIYHIDNKIIFDRNTDTFPYVFDGVRHMYLPDFKLLGKYIEVKGYYDKQVLAKIDIMKDNLIVLDKNSMVFMLEYVTNNYGRDFIELYEGNPHNQLINKCGVCDNLCKKKSKYCSRKCSGKAVSKYKL